MPGRSWQTRFRDIIAAADRIQSYTENIGEREFRLDPKTVDAVVRNLIIIGEAAAKLDDEARGKLPDTPWLEIISVRNIAVHEYFRVSSADIWRVASISAPALASQLRSALYAEGAVQ